MQPKKPLLPPRTVKRLLTISPLPVFETELLLSHVLRTSREHLVAYPETHVPFFAYLRFLFLKEQRKKDTPIAYVTKQKEFFGLTFRVSKHTLVPRPETEYLVEQALICLHSMHDAMLIDIGTGTGCIPIAIASKHPISACFALDISTKALAVAKQNFSAHNVSGTCIQSDLLSSPALTHRIQEHSGDILITANLPYLPIKNWQNEPSIAREPSVALVSGEDGLNAYRNLVSALQNHVVLRYKRYTLVCEMLSSQTKTFVEMLQKHIPRASYKIAHDSCGVTIIVVQHERAVTA